MIKYKILFCLGVVLISCKTVSINQETHKTTTQLLQLGTVGEADDFILEKDYNHIALPNFTQPIKVNVITEQFTEASYTAFTEAMASQNKTIAINYVDSLPNKPKFLKLEIADRVAILNTLNSNENLDVKQYLENKNQSHIVTTIAFASTDETINVLISAEEVFLVNEGIKSYALKLYNAKQLLQTILFTEGVVFAYKASNFCWQENSKYKLNIVDIVQTQDKCSDESYKSAKHAKKKINYYKF